MAAKVVKQEEVKQAKDGLDVWDDIHRYAAAGDYNAIDPDDIERFKWYGMYPQRPKVGHFMVRVKIPGGQLTAARLREIGLLSQQYGRNFGDVTSRQDIQLHWVQIQDMPDLLERIYNKMGMYQQFSCGDGPRNVTSCPLAGELTDEIVDAQPFAQAVSDMFKEAHKEFSNLPRKLKGAIGGCRAHCHMPQINCAGLFGVERNRNGSIEAGFGLTVGGGLRDTPHFGQSLRVFIKPDIDLVKDVFRGIAGIFRDQDQLRQGRLRARLKFYMAQIGWEAFRDQLEDRIGYKLEHDESITGPIGICGDDHMGIGQLKNALQYVGVPIPCGRLTGDQMIQIADLAEKYCQHSQRQINTTIKQNIILLNIAPDKTSDLCKELQDIGLSADAHPLRGQLLSCIGIQFCNQAVVETKNRSKFILDYIEKNVPMDESLFVSINGCPNSCVQYQTADVGLHGTLSVYKGQKGVEHFQVLVGGRLGADPTVARFIRGGDDKKLKIPAELVHLSIERLIRAYLAERSSYDRFADWAQRQQMDRLAGLVAPPGESVSASPE